MVNKVCEKCGKSMTSEKGESIVGLLVSLEDKSGNQEYMDFAKKQMGKYELNKEYGFCYECVLDSLTGRNTNWIF
jgi:hypothetical protein